MKPIKINKVRIGYYHRGTHIQCRISQTIANHKTARGVTTGIYVALEHWDKETQSIKAQNIELYKKNKELQEFKNMVQDVLFDMESKSEIMTPESVMARLLGGTVTTWAELAKHLIEKYEREVEQGVSAFGTLKYAKKATKLFSDFLVWCGRPHLLVVEFSPSLMFQYEKYLRTERKHAPNTLKREVVAVCGYVNYAHRNGFLEKNPLLAYKLPKGEKPKIQFLSEAELRKLENYKPHSKALQKVRDLFLFQSYCGLAYCDLEKIWSEELTLTENEDSTWRFWLKGFRQKTQTEFSVPMLPKAMALIQKHQGLKNLPQMTNQKYNFYLKELGELVGIDAKKMCTHVARRTCATLLLTKGVPLETVSKILGHSSTSVTERHYAKVLDLRIEKDLQEFAKDQQPKIITSLS